MAAAVSVAATACGDDDDSDGDRTGGAGGKGGTSASGGKGGTAGSQSSGGEGGDGAGIGGASATGGSGGDAGSDAGGASGSAGSGDAGGGNEGGGGGTGDECSVEEDFDDAGNVPGTAYTNLGPDIAWFGALEAGDPADGLWIDLHDEWGVFENGITTLDNHTLEGDELDPEACGVCIYITDRNDMNDPTSWEDTYFVTGGTVTLTSVEGNITGTLTNATFKKIDWDSGDWIEDGCESKIGAISFNAAIPEDPEE